MELLLGLPPMSQYDAVATPFLDFDTAPNNGDAFLAAPASSALIGQVAAIPNARSPLAKLARLTATMDLKHPDSAPAGLLNQVIWQSVKGVDAKMPAPRHTLTDAQLHFGLLSPTAAPPAQGKAAIKTVARDGDDD